MNPSSNLVLCLLAIAQWPRAAFRRSAAQSFLLRLLILLKLVLLLCSLRDETAPASERMMQAPQFSFVMVVDEPELSRSERRTSFHSPLRLLS